ncbi:MAG: OmpP1/FadL family transporter [Elusimicrobiales bacterium]
MVNIIVLIVAVLMGLAGSVNAAGFRLADQDAKATGMANAFTSVADNASAVWYNPAAITDLEGNNVSLGTILVMRTMEHKNEVGSTATDEIKEKTHIPPHFYTTFKKSDKLSFGLGVNAPFGLSTEWDATTANTKLTATKSEVQAVNYNLNAAVKASDKLSFAIGASYVAVDATLNRMVTNTIPANLEGDGHGMGYNAAVLYKHSDKLKFGVSYRSKVKTDLEGDLTTTSVTPVKTVLTLPDMMQIGVSHQCTPKWLFAVEADYTNWTTYRNIIIKKQSDGSVVSTDIKNWKSVWAFRLGSEYKYSDTLKFRAGSFYDMNPVREKHFETRVPDTDRVAFSVGAGWNKGNLTVDVAYMYLMFIERDVTDSFGGDNTSSSATDQKMNGKYNSKAHLPGITVGYKF